MRHHVGWGDDGSDDEGQDHKIAPKILEFLNAHYAHARQDDDHNGHLKGHAKSQEHGQDKAQIRLNIGRGRDAFGGKTLNKAEYLTEHEEVTEGHTDEKEQGT